MLFLSRCFFSTFSIEEVVLAAFNGSLQETGETDVWTPVIRCAPSPRGWLGEFSLSGMIPL